jgi:hypothetical protein
MVLSRLTQQKIILTSNPLQSVNNYRLRRMQVVRNPLAAQILGLQADG